MQPPRSSASERKTASRRFDAAPELGNGHSTAVSSDVLDTNQLLAVLTAARRGDFSVRMPMNQVGLAGKIADALNEILEANDEVTRELVRVSKAVGKEGRINQRATISRVGGAWGTTVEAFNGLIVDLVAPTSDVGRVIGAVAKG